MSFVEILENICLPFFFYCTVFFRLSSIVFSKRGKNRHPCPVADFWEKVFSLLTLSTFLVVNSSFLPFFNLKIFFFYSLYLERSI